VKTIDDFVLLIQHEIGLPVTAEHIGEGLDSVPGWDSLHLLTLLTALERETGRSVSMPDVLEATTLRDIYDLVAVTET
jgi:acyl carrier protein